MGLPHQESRDGTVPKTQEAAGWIWRGSLLQLEKDRENKCMQVCMFVIAPMHVFFFLNFTLGSVNIPKRVYLKQHFVQAHVYKHSVFVFGM